MFGRKAPEKPRTLGGVIAAAITPRRAGSCEIDLGAALDLIDWLGARGVDGIALMGSTGEFVHFSVEERTRLVHLGVKRSRLPVLVNVSHTTLDDAVRLGRDAADAGAMGLLLMPPYYFHYGQGQIARFFTEYANGLRRSVPLFLYNIPLFAPPIELETARKLLDTGQYAGIKDSSGDWPYLESLCRYKREREFTLLVGNDALFLPARRAGADGVVSGISSGLPELLIAVNRAALAGDAVTGEHLQERMRELIAWLNRFPVPAGVKQVTGWRGQTVGPPAMPFDAEMLASAQEFQAWFAAWLPVVLKECGHASVAS